MAGIEFTDALGGRPDPHVAVFASELSESAKEAIRFRFNSSGLDRVGKIKMLTGALLTELDAMETEADDVPPGLDVPPVYGHITRARDAVVIASMCTVLAATTGK